MNSAVYSHHVGNFGGLLIRPNQTDNNQWDLVLIDAWKRQIFIATFKTPHLAANAAARFETGNPQWDAIREMWSATSGGLEKADLDILKNWDRSD